MAAPVAAARVLNGVQDTPIDSDDAPYYRAKTGSSGVVGFVANLTAQIAFVQRAILGAVDLTGFTPQGLFVGAFVRQATLGSVTPDSNLAAGFQVAAVVQLLDALGNAAGFGPSNDPESVFFGRSDLNQNSFWRVTSVSVAGVTVTPLAGGSFTINVPASGVAAGNYNFGWTLSIAGVQSTGTKAFTVT
jgi:hypothetical protein